jgi:hypothetical protein
VSSVVYPDWFMAALSNASPPSGLIDRVIDRHVAEMWEGEEAGQVGVVHEVGITETIDLVGIYLGACTGRTELRLCMVRAGGSSSLTISPHDDAMLPNCRIDLPTGAHTLNPEAPVLPRYFLTHLVSESPGLDRQLCPILPHPTPRPVSYVPSPLAPWGSLKPAPFYLTSTTVIALPGML